MTLAVTSGTTAYSAASGTSVAPSYPASIASGDLLILLVGQKPTTANGGTISSPGGTWFAINTSGFGLGGYGATLGADTGNTNLVAYGKIADGTETGTLSVTVGDNNVCWAKILRITKTKANFMLVSENNSDATAGNVSASFSGSIWTTVPTRTGDLFIGAMCIPTDVTTPAQFSAETFTQTGTTFGTANEVGEQDSATGNDIGGFIFTQAVTAGGGIVAPSISATAGGTKTNVRGPILVIRVQEDDTPIEVEQFRFRNDDGNETTATWKAAINTTISQAVDTLFRLRMTAFNRGLSTVSPVFKLQAQWNSNGWFDVADASSIVDFEASANVTDNVATTNQLVGGTFIAGTVSETAGTDTVASITANAQTEMEYCIKMTGADVADTDTIAFRLLDGANVCYPAKSPTLTPSGGSFAPSAVPNAGMMMGCGV